MRSQSATVIDRDGVSPPIPAQLTRMSTWPRFFPIQVAISATLGSSDTSHSMARTARRLTQLFDALQSVFLITIVIKGDLRTVIGK
jgi:hypothetical protein